MEESGILAASRHAIQTMRGNRGHPHLQLGPPTPWSVNCAGVSNSNAPSARQPRVAHSGPPTRSRDSGVQAICGWSLLVSLECVRRIAAFVHPPN